MSIKSMQIDISELIASYFFMIGILDCQSHQCPINIIVSQKDGFTAYCQICFQIITKKEQQSQAVRLNTHTLDIFDSFTTYVYEKLSSWTQIIRSTSSQAIFQEINLQEKGYYAYKNEQLSKQFAIQIIEDYRQLIKANRDSVIALKSSQILYHREFLKDIYNLIMKNWRICANLIAHNYSNKLRSIEDNQRDFKIKGRFIDEIQKDRLKMISQKLEFVIAKVHPLLQEVNRVNQVKEEYKNVNFNIQEDMGQLQDYQSPCLIKKVESFQEVKSYISSGKQIEDKPGQTNFNRVKNMKKSKLIDQKGLYQIKLKYAALQEELEKIKLQNDCLKSQNYTLRLESQQCHQQNKLLRKKCEDYESLNRKIEIYIKIIAMLCNPSLPLKDNNKEKTQNMCQIYRKQYKSKKERQIKI